MQMKNREKVKKWGEKQFKCLKTDAKRSVCERWKERERRQCITAQDSCCCVPQGSEKDKEGRKEKRTPENLF